MGPHPCVVDYGPEGLGWDRATGTGFNVGMISWGGGGLEWVRKSPSSPVPAGHVVFVDDVKIFPSASVPRVPDRSLPSMVLGLYAISTPEEAA